MAVWLARGRDPPLEYFHTVTTTMLTVALLPVAVTATTYLSGRLQPQPLPA